MTQQFLLNWGMHLEKDPNTGEMRTYNAGDTVESDKDLIAMYNNPDRRDRYQKFSKPDEVAEPFIAELQSKVREHAGQLKAKDDEIAALKQQLALKAADGASRPQIGLKEQPSRK